MSHVFCPECIHGRNVGRVVLKLFITIKMRIFLLHRVDKMKLKRVPHPLTPALQYVLLLLNVFHQLVSVNLMRFPGLTPKLDICQQNKNAWKKAKASDLEGDWDTFKKVRNKFKSLIRSKNRFCLFLWRNIKNIPEEILVFF